MPNPMATMHAMTTMRKTIQTACFSKPVPTLVSSWQKAYVLYRLSSVVLCATLETGVCRANQHEPAVAPHARLTSGAWTVPVRRVQARGEATAVVEKPAVARHTSPCDGSVQCSSVLYDSQTSTAVSKNTSSQTTHPVSEHDAHLSVHATHPVPLRRNPLLQIAHLPPPGMRVFTRPHQLLCINTAPVGQDV